MSVVNKMLKDLKHRHYDNNIVQQDYINDHVTPSVILKRSNIIFRLTMLMIISAMIGLWLAFQSFVNFSSINELYHKIFFEVEPNVVLQQHSSYMTTPPVELTKFMHQSDQGVTQLKFYLNNNTHYSIERFPENNQIYIQFKNTIITNDIHFNELMPGVLNLKSQALNGTLELKLELEKDTDVTSQYYPEQKVLGITLIQTPVVKVVRIEEPLIEQVGVRKKDVILPTIQTISNVTEPSLTMPELPSSLKADKVVSKQILPENVKEARISEETLNLRYYYASQYIKQGDYKNAISQFQQILELAPHHLPSIKSLADLFIGMQQWLEAYIVLQSGLKEHKNEPDLIKRYARVLLAINEVPTALTVLEQVEEISRDTEHQVLLAAVYQRNQNHAMAVKQYQTLLSSDESQGLWWMGMALSRQHLGQHEQALEDFVKAKQKGNIAIDLQKFIDQRILSLKNNGYGYPG